MMLKSAKAKIKFKKVFYLTLSWVGAGILFTVLEYLLISPAAEIENIMELTPAVHIYSYDFLRSISEMISAAIIAGLTIGTLDIWYFQERFRKKPFGYTLFVKSLLYSFTLVSLIIAGLFIDQSFSTGESLFHPDVVEAVEIYLTSTGVWAFILYWSVVVILTQFFLQVRDNLGHGVLSNFLAGKYHDPKEESRIFMFLDLKSATTIAEKLGHVNYHNLLNDFFDDITDSIIFSYGEIYQYIGDEISVSWTLDSGIKNENCIKCFFSILDEMERKSGKYMEKYGMVPGFKAGIHFGPVTVGEIGIIKKEIVFTGDVLNTAARIEELCNTYDVKLLLSKKLLDLLKIDKKYIIKPVDEVTLKGKKTKNILYTLERFK